MSQTEKKNRLHQRNNPLTLNLGIPYPQASSLLEVGLANLPLLIILDGMSFGPFLIILLLKAVGQGMVSGTLFSYLFLISLAGTLSSGIAMKGAKQLLGPGSVLSDAPAWSLCKQSVPTSGCFLGCIRAIHLGSGTADACTRHGYQLCVRTPC